MTHANPAPPDPADFEDPEDFAEAVSVDPTPQQVNEYQELVEENAPKREDQPADPG